MSAVPMTVWVAAVGLVAIGLLVGLVAGFISGNWYYRDRQLRRCFDALERVQHNSEKSRRIGWTYATMSRILNRRAV